MRGRKNGLIYVTALGARASELGTEKIFLDSLQQAEDGWRGLGAVPTGKKSHNGHLTEHYFPAPLVMAFAAEFRSCRLELVPKGVDQ
jgi:hypothetical protein